MIRNWDNFPKSCGDNILRWVTDNWTRPAACVVCGKPIVVSGKICAPYMELNVEWPDTGQCGFAGFILAIACLDPLAVVTRIIGIIVAATSW